MNRIIGRLSIAQPRLVDTDRENSGPAFVPPKLQPAPPLTMDAWPFPPPRPVCSKERGCQQKKMGFDGEMDGCGQFIKYSMFVSNFIIFVGGLTVFGLGIWTVMDKSFINELLGTNLYMGAVYIIITSGAIVTLIAFFGCLGAIKEIKCMLLTYALFLFIVLVVMLVGGILGYVFREKVRHTMEVEMYSTIKQYNEKRSIRRAWDDTQDNLQCCGVTTFSDWRGNIPDSCCRELNGKKVNCKSFPTALNIYTSGCLNITEKYVKEHASIIGASAVTVSGLMVLGLIFSLVMFKLIE